MTTGERPDALFPVRVRVLDLAGREVGTQEHGLPFSELSPHVSDPAALDAFARDDLVPRLAQLTLAAMATQVPPDRLDALLAQVGSVEIVLGPDSPQPVSWTLRFGSDAASGGEEA